MVESDKVGWLQETKLVVECDKVGWLQGTKHVVESDRMGKMGWLITPNSQ